jgi:DNA invertase Pin-like site-specific DNA recombinase
MAGAHRRHFDVVLCWKIDRFGRSLKHLVNALADLDSYGIAFVSLRDNLDLSTPSGRLMFQIIGAMAEFERSLIQERVRAGLLWFAKTLCDSFSGPHVTLLHPITRQNPASLAPFRCR